MTQTPYSMTDTIAAVATAPGEAGIAVIRLSGPDSIAIARRVFTPNTPLKAAVTSYEPGRLYYGCFHEAASLEEEPKGKSAEERSVGEKPSPKDSPDEGGDFPIDNSSIIDDGFLVFMKAPRSYTGEDSVEFQVHGSALVTRKLLEAALASGARSAEPGEFTRRAFLNGRLDLTQAEAVGDLINARTASALSSARGRLDGRLSKKVRTIREGLVTLLTNIEAELDFPEDFVKEEPTTDKNEDGEIGASSGDDLLKIFEGALVNINGLLITYEEGRALKDGVSVVILGRANVGKSSLLNVLLKEDRAIVTEVPGTTRDYIEEVVNVRGLALRLMDTAGLRETTDHVETLGVERARERASRADLILYVIDSAIGGEDRKGDFSEDREELRAIIEEGEEGASEGGGEGAGAKLIVVANKTDLVSKDEMLLVSDAFIDFSLVFVSALTEDNIDLLEDKLYQSATSGGGGGRVGVLSEAEAGELVTSVWQKDALAKAAKALGRAAEGIDSDVARELLATDIREAIDLLGQLTGETTPPEEILNRIFSTFCIGK